MCWASHPLSHCIGHSSNNCRHPSRAPLSRGLRIPQDLGRGCDRSLHDRPPACPPRLWSPHLPLELQVWHPRPWEGSFFPHLLDLGSVGNAPKSASRGAKPAARELPCRAARATHVTDEIWLPRHLQNHVVPAVRPVAKCERQSPRRCGKHLPSHTPVAMISPSPLHEESRYRRR